jgi:hypothetical protein
MSSAVRALPSSEESRKLYGTSPAATVRSRGPVQEYPDAESLVRSFAALTAIGEDGMAEILSRMLARQREALGSSDNTRVFTHDANREARRAVLARMCVRLRIANQSSCSLASDKSFPVAAHESGHCVAAWLQGKDFDSVSISETERGGVRGRVRFLSAVDCTILLAGMAAETILLGYAEEECAWSDLERARRIARSTCSDDRLVEAFLDRKLRETISLLESHRSALLAVTGELIDKRHLSGHEVNDIISNVLAGTFEGDRRRPKTKSHLPADQGARLLQGSR